MTFCLFKDESQKGSKVCISNFTNIKSPVLLNKNLKYVFRKKSVDNWTQNMSRIKWTWTRLETIIFDFSFGLETYNCINKQIIRITICLTRK